MSAELRGFLKRRIIDHGPVDIGAFMAIALGHPRYGYYMRKDPFGADGDFTTAPEISQMFGEVIGAWMADAWMRLGRPERFTLAECGPGRGTLMADMLRVTSAVPGFREAMTLCLVETSPALKAMQAETLSAYDPVWLADIGSLPKDKPVLLIGNEFLDALPIRQLVRAKGGWAEKVVGLDDSGGFSFGLAPAPPQLAAMLPPDAGAAETGAVYEVSTARERLLRGLCQALEAQGGAALFIDYGHTRRATGDTLQAVYRHAFCNVLERVGDADLTAHVDFAALCEAAQQEGVHAGGPVAQGEFLRAVGIELRAQALSRNARPDQKKAVADALARLTDEQQMGSLFKALALSSGLEPPLPGFA